MRKKIKRKRVKDRLAKKRGVKKTKKKIPPPKSKKTISPEILNNLMMNTFLLGNLEGLRDIKFDEEKLTVYLNSTKNAPEQKPIDFIRDGIKTTLTQEIFGKVNGILSKSAQEKDEQEQVLIAIDAYFKILQMHISPEFIPMFAILFARQVKLHPLSDDPKIWKYIMDFLPKKVVAPQGEKNIIIPGKQKETEKEKQQEKRDERYPHIVLPK